MKARSPPCSPSRSPPRWWSPRAAAADDTAGGGSSSAAAPPRPAARRRSSRSSPTRPRRSSTTRSSPRSRRPRAGKGVGFKTSFGASGDQSRAVEAGLQADVVDVLARARHDRLVKAGLVAADWNERRRTRASSPTSVVAFVVRKGNPKNIKTWDDLLKPGVKVLTPNPFTSGAAKWNLLAAYGAKRRTAARTPQAGLDYLQRAASPSTSTVQDKSGREALQTFTARQRRRAALLRERGDHRPEEGPGRRLRAPRRHDQDREPDSPTTEGAAAAGARRSSTTCCPSPAQETFADWGYRPVDQAVARQRTRRSSRRRRACSRSTTSAAGRRSTTSSSTRRTGSVAKIEEDAGVSTAK